MFGAPAPYPLAFQSPTAAGRPALAFGANAPSPALPPVARRVGASALQATPPPRPPLERLGATAEVQLVGTGAGRAALILSGGQAAMVDAGSSAVAAEAVQRLEAAGIHRLEAVLLVRHGAAAAQGLPLVLRQMKAARLVVPGPRPEPGFRESLAAARAAGVPVGTASRGSTLAVGDARIEWLWPPQGLGQPADGGGSGLIRVQAGRVVILLAGSFDPAEEDALVRLGGPLRAQVLEVPAGGAGRLSAAFLRAVSPRVAVVGDAPDQAGPAVVQQLAAAGVAVVHGGRLSDLTLATDGRRVTVAFDPGPAEEPLASGTGTGQ